MTVVLCGDRADNDTLDRWPLADMHAGFHVGVRLRGRGERKGPVDHRLDVLSALEVMPADVVVEVQRPEVGGELLRNVVRVAIDFHGVAHDVKHGAALDAGADAVILEMHGNRDLDALAGDQT